MPSRSHYYEYSSALQCIAFAEKGDSATSSRFASSCVNYNVRVKSRHFKSN